MALAAPAVGSVKSQLASLNGERDRYEYLCGLRSCGLQLALGSIDLQRSRTRPGSRTTSYTASRPAQTGGSSCTIRASAPTG